MTDVELPDTVYGIDFSVARNDAGRNTWIAECTPRDERLVVDRLADAAGFLECSPGREAMLASLVDLVVDGTDERRAFGMDFPFGLPASLLGDDVEDWQSFVSGVRERHAWGALGEVADPRSLYDGAERHVDDRDDLLRETDAIRRGQRPTGFRIKTQTYYGISGVLAEVATVDGAAILPMDDPGADTAVLETYPAATFRRLDDELGCDVHDTGYKRDIRASIERRQANVEALREAGVVFGDHGEFAVASDNALDAVAAAYATWQAGECGYSPDDLRSESGDADPACAVEGYIYC